MKTTISRRYAQAFFDYISEVDTPENVEKEVSWLKDFIKSSEDLQLFLKSPIISVEKRIKILKDVFKKHLSKSTFIYLLFLENKNRLGYLEKICDEFEKIYLKSKNTICPRIATAIPLNTKQLKKICIRLKNRYQKDVSPKTYVDPKLLGGIRIQINDQIIDYSLRYQLNNFVCAFTHV